MKKHNQIPCLLGTNLYELVWTFNKKNVSHDVDYYLDGRLWWELEYIEKLVYDY